MKTEKPQIEYTTFEQLLNNSGYLVYTNVGYSMMPLLRQRKDVITIKKKDTERCKKYDVVLYKCRDKYILHRILKVLPNGYLIAGDNCTIVERDVRDENILGVMTQVRRNGKTITTDNTWYKIYVHLWCDVYPVRMFILKIKAFVCRCFRFVKRRVLRIIKKK